MNRTIEDATVQRFHYESHDQLRQHFTDFVAAYNFARRLKTLKGLTPYEFICKAWAAQQNASSLIRSANAGTSLFGVLKAIAFKLPLPRAFDVFREAVLLFGIGALALPAWDQLE